MSSRAEYLKKYLSGADGKKKKNKSKPSSASSHMKVLDNEEYIPTATDADRERKLALKAKYSAILSGDFSGDDDDEDGPTLSLPRGLTKARLQAGDVKLFKTDGFVTLNPSPSPPRRQRHDSSDDDESGCNTPPRRRRHDSEDDDQVPRRPARHDDADDSPPRRPATTTDDQSPPRRRRRATPDASPPRRGEQRLRATQHDSSPPRKRARSPSSRSRQVSPPRKVELVKKEEDIKEEPLSDDDDARGKTLDGKRAGLQYAKDLREETRERKAREAKAFDQDDATLGRHAGTVVRDRFTGKRRDVDAENEAEREKEREQEALAEKYKSWNRGVKQLAAREENVKEAQRVAAEPLARYKDNADLDAHLMAQELKDDPMLKYMRKREVKRTGAAVYPRYSGPAPQPNRYGLLPGYRWDGVDRSTGFEEKLMESNNDRRAENRESYKFSSGSYE